MNERLYSLAEVARLPDCPDTLPGRQRILDEAVRQNFAKVSRSNFEDASAMPAEYERKKPVLG